MSNTFSEITSIESPWAAWGRYVGAMIDFQVARAADHGMAVESVEVDMIVVGDPNDPSEWGVNATAYDADGKAVVI